MHKSSNKRITSNYRPVTILQLYQRLGYNRLWKFIDKNNLIFNGQYGFRKNHSTCMASLKFVDDIAFKLDNHVTAAALFLDLSKAFDTIDHQISLRKMHMYDVRGVALKWIQSYFSNRTQFVRCKSKDSSSRNINIGLRSATRVHLRTTSIPCIY